MSRFSRNQGFVFPTAHSLFGAALFLGQSACSLPDVNLATREPLKVDINVKMDVYQYSKPAVDAADSTPKTVTSVTERKRNRMEQVQTLKNNRFVGENHLGLLNIRDLPAGEQGDYVKRTVEEENQDRIFLMVEQAKKDNLQMHEVQEREWKLNIDRAFPGEWIEVLGPRPGSFQWKTKEKK
jgi:Protein of unknown function (DUF1318)